MQLNWRERLVLGKLAGGDWHRPARLISAKIGYQRVQICLRHLLELGLVERERVGQGDVRPRYQYRIMEAGSKLAEGQSK